MSPRGPLSTDKVDIMDRMALRTICTALMIAVAGACSDSGFEVPGEPTPNNPVTQSVTQVVATPDSVHFTALGQSAVLSVSARNGLGETVAGISFAFASSVPSVVEVDDIGRLTARAAGTALITVSALCCGSDSPVDTVVAVVEQAPPGTTQVELPREFLDTSMPTTTGSTINVPAGGDFQAALDAAQPGDQILLAAGAVFTGNFVLPAKGGTDWIVIRTDTDLPPEGTRMTPASAGQLATIQAQNNVPIISTQAGAAFYRFVGVEFAMASSVSQTFNMVWIDQQQSPATLAGLPHDIVFDRVYCHGHATLDVRRCIFLNATRSAVIDSYIAEIHANFSDAQAILGINSPGPIKIVNNFLEASGENVMFGGGDSSGPELSPSDIEIRGNHFFKPPSWFSGLQWSVKNLLELKNAKRVLVEGNFFENTWRDSQTGSAILFWSVNQGGACAFCETSHITFRFNRIENVIGAFNLAASWGTAVPAHSMAIHDNVITRVGLGSDWASGGGAIRVFQILGAIHDVELSHNTVIMGAGEAVTALQEGPPVVNLAVTNNVFGEKWIGSGTGEGLHTLQTYADAATLVFSGNVIYRAPSTLYPSGNFFPESLAEVGFADLLQGDYQLSPTSPFRGVGTGGRDPGANITTVDALTAGAR